MQHGVADHQVEGVVLVRNGLGIGNTAVDRKAEAFGIAQCDLDHAGREVGDRTGLGDSTLHQVQEEESGATTEFERALVRERLIARDGVETTTCVVDAALVVRDGPLVVVGFGFPVVVEHLGELGVLTSGLDLFGRGVRPRRGVDYRGVGSGGRRDGCVVIRAGCHGGYPTRW